MYDTDELFGETTQVVRIVCSANWSSFIEAKLVVLKSNGDLDFCITERVCVTKYACIWSDKDTDLRAQLEDELCGCGTGDVS